MDNDSNVKTSSNTNYDSNMKNTSTTTTTTSNDSSKYNNDSNNNSTISSSKNEDGSRSSGSGSKTASAADGKVMMQSGLHKHRGDNISLSAPTEVNHAGVAKDVNKLYKVAARNLRHDHGVRSMTPADLKKTMALLELRPRRLVVHSLAPRGLLRGRSRQDTPKPDGDDTNAMAAVWECVDTNNDGSSDSHDRRERELEEDMTGSGSDGGQQPPGGGSNSDSDDHNNKAQHRRGDGKTRRPIHAALVAGGIKIRPCETRPLLHALGVGPGRLVRLGLVDREALGVRRGEKGRHRGHGVHEGRRRGGNSLGHPAFRPPRPRGHGHGGGGHERRGSGDESGHGRHGPCHRSSEYGSPFHGRRGGLCFSCWDPHGPHSPDHYGKAHGEVHGRHHGGHMHDENNMHGGSGDEPRHPPHGHVPHLAPEHEGREHEHVCRGAHGHHGPPHRGHFHDRRATGGGRGRGARRMTGYVMAY